MSNDIDQVTWTSPTGRLITISMANNKLTMTVAGVANDLPVSILGGNAVKQLAPALAANFSYVVSASTKINDKSTNVQCGVPANMVAALLMLKDAAEANRPKSRQEQYNHLAAKYAAAKRDAENAREKAYANDTGKGFDRAQQLDEIAEAARLAVVAFGDMHQSDVAADDAD